MIDFLSSMPGAAAQGIIWGIMAIGVYLTYKILDVADLTVDGSFATGGAVLVVCVTNGMNVWLAMFIAFLAGCVAGFATGIFYTKFGIPAILSGILMQLSLYSINLHIMSEKANLPLSVEKYDILISLRNIPNALIITVILTILLIGILYWFFGTELGHSIRATGSNRAMAKANGINTDSKSILGLVLSNGIVAFSGALLAQYQGFCDINMGRGAIVIGLAAVIIGNVVFGKIFKNFALRLLSAVFGGIIYYVVITLVLRVGLNANDLKLFSAIVVAIFLGIPYWKRKISERKVSSFKETKNNSKEVL